MNKEKRGGGGPPPPGGRDTENVCRLVF